MLQKKSDTSENYDGLSLNRVNLAQSYALKKRSAQRVALDEKEGIIHSAFTNAVMSIQSGRFSRLLQRLNLMDSTILSRKADEDILEKGSHSFKVYLNGLDNSLQAFLKAAFWLNVPKLKNVPSVEELKQHEAYRFHKEYFNEIGMDFAVKKVSTEKQDEAEKKEKKEAPPMGAVYPVAALVGGAGGILSGTFIGAVLPVLTASGSGWVGAALGGYALVRLVALEVKHEKVPYLDIEITPHDYDMSHLDEKFGAVAESKSANEVVALEDHSGAQDDLLQAQIPANENDAVGVPVASVPKLSGM